MATTFPQNLMANPSLDGATSENPSESAQSHPSSLHPSRMPDEATAMRTELFLLGALAALGGSLLMRAAHQREASQWLERCVSPLVMCGVYNEVSKRGGFASLLPDRSP